MTALSGRGVAVVRRALVQQLIDTGQLILLFPEHRWPLTWSYYLVMSEQSRMRPEVKVLHDWLVQDVSDSLVRDSG
jgi:LysR family glycine cleavage system transcriptional activator